MLHPCKSTRWRLPLSCSCGSWNESLSQDFHLTQIIASWQWAARDILMYIWVWPSRCQKREKAGCRRKEERYICWPRETRNGALIFDSPGLVLKRPGNILFLSLEVYDGSSSNLTIHPLYWGLIICANACQSPWDGDCWKDANRHH